MRLLRMMRFELGFLPGFQSDFLHLSDDLFRKDVVKQFLVRHPISFLFLF